MKLHYLQHVPFENLGNIEPWVQQKGIELSKTQLFQGQILPKVNTFDWLIVLGGPMNVYEEKKYPWLIEEKKFIEQAIIQGKLVLGICLGAQLIASVLGSKVYKNQYKEIGWFDINLLPDSKKSNSFHSLPEQITAFHWHGDTFDLPDKARWLAQSEACKNQAFEFNDKTVGLQFHLESSKESIRNLINNCQDEIISDKYIQSPEIMVNNNYYDNLKVVLDKFLNNLYSINII